MWARSTIHLDTPESWLSTVTLSPEALERLTRSTVLLAALYHPEYFPLPRFPLGINDLARAARSTLTGQIELMDMQLGVTPDAITATMAVNRPDILGVSATFGQHDLLVRLLNSVAVLPHRPLVLAGGSLTARNERLLLERYPWLLVARGAGEPTIADILAYWHDDLDLNQVHGIGYPGAPRGEGTVAIGRFRRRWLTCCTGRGSGGRPPAESIKSSSPLKSATGTSIALICDGNCASGVCGGVCSASSPASARS